MATNRKKILEQFSDFLNQKEGAAFKTSGEEGGFISEFQNEVMNAEKVRVPDQFMKTILEKSSHKNAVESESFYFRKIFHLLTRPVAGASFAGIIAFMIFFSYIYYTATVNKPLDLASIESFSNGRFTSLGEGGKIYGKGIILHVRNSGEISQEVVEQEETELRPRHNIYLKSGFWYIATHHDALEKETWFYFPGGALKPIGTRFNIQVKEQETVVTLNEGKIEIIKSDENGNPLTHEVAKAPYQGVFNRGKQPAFLDQKNVKVEKKPVQGEIRTANPLQVKEEKKELRKTEKAQTDKSPVNTTTREAPKVDPDKDVFDNELKNDMDQRFPDDEFHEEESIEEDDMEMN